MLKQRIEQDLKTALLSRDALRVSVLRSLKSAIIYAEVAAGVKGGAGLDEPATIDVIAKEAKKRQESADAFTRNAQQARADQELAEKAIIEAYLPPMISEEELQEAVNRIVAELGGGGPQLMGRVITQVKEEIRGRIDGAVLARLVKERLQN